MPIFNGGRIGSNNEPFTGTKSDDPNYSSVSLLLNGNGTNGSTTFTDSSSYGHTVTPVGNAQISTTQSKFGGSSMYFDGSGDYLEVPPSAGFDFDYGSFTVEAWIYLTANGTTAAGTTNWPIVNKHSIYNTQTSTGGSNTAWAFRYSPQQGNKLVFVNRIQASNFTEGVNLFTKYSTAVNLSLNTWYHVAAVRNGTTLKLFLNGQDVTDTNTGNYDWSTINMSLDTGSIGQNKVRVGRILGGSNPGTVIWYAVGYIDDLRITKGVARYTSNFNPPTAQLPGGETGTFASGLWTGLEQCDAIRREIWPGFVPPIVTDGLVLHLDAGDSASYPGSGTTWTDLSGNGNHFSWSSPAPTYTTYNNTPVISTTNTYTSLRAVRSNTYNGMRTGTGPYTVFSFFRPNQTTSTKILISFGPANNNCSGQNIHPIGIGPNGKFVGGSCGGLGTWSSSAGVTPTTGRFWNVCTTYDGTTERVYVDGVLDKSASSFTNNTPVSTSNAISLGWIRDDGASYSMDASIGIILIYNKALTQSEITQNYNVLKGRYGL